MSRWIAICMFAALICGSQTESEIDDDIIRLTQSNSKHVNIQIDKTATRRKHIKVVKHINASDKRLNAFNHSNIDPKLKGRTQQPRKINERRFVKKVTDRRKVKFRRKHLKKKPEIHRTKPSVTNTVKVKRAETVPGLSLPDIEMPNDRNQYSGPESIEESDSEFHTANNFFLLQMEKEEEQSDISKIDPLRSRRSNRYYKIKRGGGALNDKTNMKSEKQNEAKLVQTNKHKQDHPVKPKNVAPVTKQNKLPKKNKKPNKTSPPPKGKQDKQPKSHLKSKQQIFVTPIIEDDISEKDEEETKETKDKTEIISGSSKIADESLSDGNYMLEKQDKETNKKTKKAEFRESSPESSDEMSKKHIKETNEEKEKFKTRNSSAEIDDEIKSVSDDKSENYEETTNQTAYMAMSAYVTPFVRSSLESTEVNARAKSFKSCLNKDTLKLCIQSCHNAFVDACKRIKCARKPKLELRKQCKKSCKATFGNY